MSLRDDMDAMQRHIDNGTAHKYLHGTAPRLPEPMPTDRTATMQNASTYAVLRARGD